MVKGGLASENVGETMINLIRHSGDMIYLDYSAYGFRIITNCKQSDIRQWMDFYFDNYKNNPYMLLQLDYWLQSRGCESKLTTDFSWFEPISFLLGRVILLLNRVSIKVDSEKFWELD